MKYGEQGNRYFNSPYTWNELGRGERHFVELRLPAQYGSFTRPLKCELIEVHRRKDKGVHCIIRKPNGRFASWLILKEKDGIHQYVDNCSSLNECRKFTNKYLWETKDE